MKTHRPSTSIRWGIIGCGDVTEVKSGPAYQHTEHFELSAVMRRDKHKAQDYAARHNIKNHYTQADSIIFNDDIDAIYIATPPDTHKFYGLQVATAGKPCCIEKPLAVNYQDSLSIYQAFEHTNTPLFVAYYRRSLPRFNKIKSLIDAGEVGEIRHIQWQLSRPPNSVDSSGQSQWRTDKNIAPGGYFDDLACHGLNLFAYLLGDFIQVEGMGFNQQGLYSAFDAVSACWSHSNNITGCGYWNFSCHHKQDKVDILGSSGTISFSVFEEASITLSTAQRQEDIFIANPNPIQLYHVLNMKEQLINRIKHPSDGKSALHTSWVMDKILGGIAP
ncbi:Gfo/Idh/MocA family protein [Shewanella surugensis]|uniref:Gfo/Idh/MocA family oxidoreductase n=1 Tax=Shewanella surugensis TaxID=212020 RepID=A0ABT0LEI8_9GAMM|nr:Gfo/Idh/MocA family oxidoreductase [Shewanella surugensis]MCL1125742.1 Gfo/Idh/MocA family oxidoreductase [Shewanella surugensis]